ncbi:hypothetical protein PHLGIDRAFT_299238 [Phlebiopsis gigantea 11061_1 CR5-6]|uniref:Uncharacterized protein n=1 Tax=Phlebiopsis gigantea (strain 11061_1 CR5-6) TaxID=745531 RepID=A0A0C3RQX6_PHLG1|nr:hypothetical protein PHLGIDRAFT_299238 [Phlebiopsis gigantea 11061_1 CR5-6]
MSLTCFANLTGDLWPRGVGCHGHRHDALDIGGRLSLLAQGIPSTMTAYKVRSSPLVSASGRSVICMGQVGQSRSRRPGHARRHACRRGCGTWLPTSAHGMWLTEYLGCTQHEGEDRRVQVPCQDQPRLEGVSMNGVICMLVCWMYLAAVMDLVALL